MIPMIPHRNRPVRAVFYSLHPASSILLYLLHCNDLINYNLIDYDLIDYGLINYGLINYGLIDYDLIRNGHESL